MIPRSPTAYTGISGIKIWEDSGDAAGRRPSFITVQLIRDGAVFDTRTLTASTGWSYAFDELPVDDGYGHTYTYEIREVGVPGYYMLMDGYTITNSLIPEVPRAGFDAYTEEELEELLDLFDYDTPLWGGLLGTGDDLPIYPFVFGAIGALAVILLVVTDRRRRGEA